MEKSGIANNYQYYRQTENGWVISVVCKEAFINGHLGNFEVAVWNVNEGGNRAIHVIATDRDFFEVSDILVDWKKDPEELYQRCD